MKTYLAHAVIASLALTAFAAPVSAQAQPPAPPPPRSRGEAPPPPPPPSRRAWAYSPATGGSEMRL